MTITDFILGFVPPAILVVIAIIFLRRKLYREFVFFFTYVLYSIIAGMLYEVIGGQPFLRFWLYWITEAVDGILALLVLREVFLRIFALPHATFRWFRLLLPATVLSILSISVWEMTYRPLGSGAAARLVSAIYWFDFGVHALEGTILMLVLALTLVFPVEWRNYGFGVLTGFGISASVTMFADLLRFLGGSAYETFFRFGPPIAYVLATLIWLHAFIHSPANQSRTQMDLNEMLAVVRRSNELLEKIKKAVGLRQQRLAA